MRFPSFLPHPRLFVHFSKRPDADHLVVSRHAIDHCEFNLKLTGHVKMKMVRVPKSSFDFRATIVPFSPFQSSLPAILTNASLICVQYFAQGYKVGRVDQCKTALGAEICNKDDKAAGGKAGMQRMGRRLCGGS